ncbi:MAG: hypothetical protein EBR82_26645 [Caulobacteraceae bacterium]|nr:hypothetical protein [Caulobacteraceae bacterium]
MLSLDEIRKEIEIDKEHILSSVFPEDQAGEYADSAVPIYYQQIVQDWNSLDSEDQNRFSEITDQFPERIEDLMKLDLYLYYFNAYSMAINELLESEEVN